MAPPLVTLSDEEQLATSRRAPAKASQGAVRMRGSTLPMDSPPVSAGRRRRQRPSRRRASGSGLGAHTPVRAETGSTAHARLRRGCRGGPRPGDRRGHSDHRRPGGLRRRGAGATTGVVPVDDGHEHDRHDRCTTTEPSTTTTVVAAPVEPPPEPPPESPAAPPPERPPEPPPEPSPERDDAVPSPVDRVVAYALAQRGRPYRRGAAGPGAFDCSGLTRAAYATVGVDLPHYSVTQADRGRAIDWRTEPIRAGDLVFVRGDTPVIDLGHVGLAVSATEWVVASRPGVPVRVTRIPTAIQRVRRVFEN